MPKTAGNRRPGMNACSNHVALAQIYAENMIKTHCDRCDSVLGDNGWMKLVIKHSYGRDELGEIIKGIGHKTFNFCITCYEAIPNLFWTEK